MIAYLNGILAVKEIAKTVVECGGVGYEAAIPLSTFDRLPAVGERVKLYTHHEVREDAQLLFGFATERERDIFELIITVSGVGPKIALGILSGLTVADLQMAISSGDAKRLSAVKGVGKKTAERLVVELRDRINPIEAMAAAGAAAAGDERGNILKDAMMALGALGYGEDEARRRVQQALEKDPTVGDTQTLVRRALSGA